MNDSKTTPKFADKSIVYGVLANERRRIALKLLNKAGTPLTLQDIAREIARCEKEEREDQIQEAQVQRIQISLYHLHVPKLADADLVQFMREERRVALSESVSFDELPVLE